MRWIFLLCMWFCAYAVQANPLLDDIQSRISKPDVLRGQFIQQKYLKGFKKPLISKGDFVIWREHGLLWHTKQPFASNLTLRRDKLELMQANGTTSYQLDKSNEPGLRMVNELIFSLFSGELKVLQRYFAISGQTKDKQDWLLVLTPVENSNVRIFKRIELRGNVHVQQINLEAVNGDVTQIAFDKLAVAPSISSEERSQLHD